MVDRPKSSPHRSYKELQDAHAVVVAANKRGEIRSPQISPLGRWQMYRRNAVDYLAEYASVFLITPLIRRLAEKRESGQRVTVLDAAGAADAGPIGATHTINVVLQKNIEMEALEGPQRTFVSGDICRGETQADVIRTIDSIDLDGADCIFFQPGSAFSLEDENEYVSTRIFAFFSLLLTKLKNEGDLFCRLDSAHNTKWFKPVVQSLNAAIGDDIVLRDKGEIRLSNGRHFAYEFAVVGKPDYLGEQKWDRLPGGVQLYVHLSRLK